MDWVTIVEDQSDSQVADWIYTRLNAALNASHRPVAITIPGGSTPFPILEKLITRDLDWSRIVIWPNDDRIVPEDHAASNTGKIRALVEPVGATVIALTDNIDPPPFAITWLGMGLDGHIASLFPNTNPQVDDAQMVRRLTPDPLPPEAPFDRITLTMPALLNCDDLVFLTRGADKRVVFRAAAMNQIDVPAARLITAAKVPITWFG